MSITHHAKRNTYNTSFRTLAYQHNKTNSNFQSITFSTKQNHGISPLLFIHYHFSVLSVFVPSIYTVNLYILKGHFNGSELEYTNRKTCLSKVRGQRGQVPFIMATWTRSLNHQLLKMGLPAFFGLAGAGGASASIFTERPPTSWPERSTAFRVSPADRKSTVKDLKEETICWNLTSKLARHQLQQAESGQSLSSVHIKDWPKTTDW